MAQGNGKPQARKRSAAYRTACDRADCVIASPHELAELLPHPARDANKFTRGKLVLVAGSDRYPGAACLAAVASQRMGAGYTEVVTAPSAVQLVRLYHPSLVVMPRAAWKPAALSHVRPGHPCAVSIGSGFDADDPETPALVDAALSQAACSVLADGGALSYLATPAGLAALAARAQTGRATVLTPHGGEATRLAQGLAARDAAAASVLDDARAAGPAAMARTLSQLLGAVVVLKGPDTYVSDGVRTVAVTTGTPALAKAGTGDVLAGMTASLLAQGLEPLDAGVLAAELHARAGRDAAERLGDISVSAEDVVGSLPAAVRELSSCEG